MSEDDIHRVIGILSFIDDYLVKDNRTDPLEIESYRLGIADAISILSEYDDLIGGVDDDNR
jgi:hypothetical protein